MPVSLEVVQAAGNVVEYRMMVEIPKEQVTTEIESKLKELGRTTKIKGFRQGKVPLRIIDQRFGQWVRQEVVGRLIEQSFRDSLQEQNLQPLGPPAIQLQDDRIQLEQGLFYTAIFTAIAPEGTAIVGQSAPESPLEMSDIPLFTASTSQPTTTDMPVVTIDGLVLDKPLVDNPTATTKPSTIQFDIEDPLKDIPFFTAPVKTSEQLLQSGEINLGTEDPLKDIPFFTAPVQTSEQRIQFGEINLEKEPVFTLSTDESTPIHFAAPNSELTFTILPEKTLSVDGLTVEKWVAKVTPDDVETMLNRLRQQRQTWLNVETAAQMGDQLMIDLIGTINGEPFKNNEIRQWSLILGENRLGLPTFETHLVGMRAGEQKTVEVTVPHDHYNTEIAGKNVQFVVTVHSVARSQWPALDSEFAKTLGVEDGNVATLRRETRENMEAQLQEVLHYRLRRQVLSALLKANPIEAPPALVEQEANYLLQQALQEFPAEHASKLTAAAFTQQAEQRIQLGLLVVQLAKEHSIQIGAEEMRQRVEKIALAYENSDDIINQYYADPKRLGEIYSLLLEERIATWLLERVRLVEKKTDFYTVMNSQAG